MGAGASIDKAFSTQIAEADVAQNYTGTCDIKCDNQISDVVIDIENSTVGGGIIFDQQCDADTMCMFNVSESAIADVSLAQQQTQKAGNAGDWLSGLFNFDETDATNYQEARSVINQQITEKCKVESINDIDNVTVYATNSDIKGPIGFYQKGNAAGTCAMNAMMKGTADASAKSEQAQTTGKKADKKKGTTSGLIEIIIIVVVVVVVVIIIAVVIFSVYKHNKGKNKTTGATGVSMNPDLTALSSDVLSLDLL